MLSRIDVRGRQARELPNAPPFLGPAWAVLTLTLVLFLVGQITITIAGGSADGAGPADLRSIELTPGELGVRPLVPGTSISTAVQLDNVGPVDLSLISFSADVEGPITARRAGLSITLDRCASGLVPRGPGALCSGKSERVLSGYVPGTGRVALDDLGPSRAGDADTFVMSLHMDLSADPAARGADWKLAYTFDGRQH